MTILLTFQLTVQLTREINEKLIRPYQL